MVVLTSFSPPTEGIKHEQASTKLYISNREVGCGTLYITESNLSWRNDGTGKGFSLLYPHIAVHAVSRDIQSFGNECMIIMVDTCLDDIEDQSGEEDSKDDDSEDEGRMTEMRFVPNDKNQLNAMYQAMTYCQSQHPDPTNSLSDDEDFVDADEEGDDTWAGGDAEGVQNGQDANNRNDLERALNGHSINNQHGVEEMETDGQFEDAEDD